MEHTKSFISSRYWSQNKPNISNNSKISQSYWIYSKFRENIDDDTKRDVYWLSFWWHSYYHNHVVIVINTTAWWYIQHSIQNILFLGLELTGNEFYLLFLRLKNYANNANRKQSGSASCELSNFRQYNIDKKY